MNKEDSFSMEMNDIVHSQFHFKEYVSIMDVIQQNSNIPISAIDFKLRIPMISDWDELNIGQHLYFLQNINVIEFEIIEKSPIKYKCRINIDKAKIFKEWTDNAFLLESNYTKEEFYALIKRIEQETFDESFQYFLKHWEETILKKYSISERKQALIQQRNKEIDLYDSDKNIVRFYDLSNIAQLAENIHEAVRYKHKIPIDPNYPDTFLGRGIQSLERALRLRFLCWYKIQTLNELIDSQNGGLEGKSKTLRNALDNENIGEIIKVFNTNIANIPYDHLKVDSEGFYNAILNVILQNNISIEDFIDQKHNNIGRSDIIIFRPKHIYCIELKINKTAKEALEQIFEKKYLEPYKLEEKILIALGVNISTINKRIDDFDIKKLLES